MASWKAWRWDGTEIRPFRGGISLADRGFRYGQHLFETIAIRRRTPLLAEDHLAILAASAKREGIPFSRTLAARLRVFLHSVAIADGLLRIYLSAGPGSPGSPVRTPGCYLTWESIEFPTSADVERGITLTLLKKPFLGEGWGVKSGNYAVHIGALDAARKSEADEGVVLDAQGRIISCAMGNLLLWVPEIKAHSPILYCPSQASGPRSGAVLSWLKRHTRVVERELSASDLGKAVAVAVTNSRLGVMPVSRIDGKKLPDPSHSRTLAKEYLQAHGLLGKS